MFSKQGASVCMCISEHGSENSTDLELVAKLSYK